MVVFCEVRLRRLQFKRVVVVRVFMIADELKLTELKETLICRCGGKRKSRSVKEG